MFFHHLTVRLQRYLVSLSVGISIAIAPSICCAQNKASQAQAAHPPAAQQQLEALTKDAEAGDKNAQFRLGTMYLSVPGGVSSVHEHGIAWLKQAAAQGHLGARQRLSQELVRESTQKTGIANAETGYHFDSDGKLIPTKPSEVKWDALSEKPPVGGLFDDLDEKKPSKPTATETNPFGQFLDKTPGVAKSDGNAPVPNYFDKSQNPSVNGAEQNNHRSLLPTGTVGAVLAGVLLAFACSYTLFWLLGKSVEGSTPVATGRRWMNWVVLLALMQPLTKVFSLLIGGYGDPGKELALGVAGAVVLGFAAFVIGALWSRFRPKTRQATAEAKAEVGQYRNGWMDGGSRVSSTSNAPQMQPTASTSTPVDEMPIPEIVIAGGAVNQENRHRAQVENALKNSVTVTTDVEQEDFWAAAMAEVESGQRRPGVWARAFAEADGDESKAKAAYLRVRVQQLNDASVELAKRNEAAKLDELFRQRAIASDQQHAIENATSVFVQTGQVSAEDLTLLVTHGDLSQLVKLSDRRRGNSLLHLCAQAGLYDEVGALLRAGADVGCANGNGQLPIHLTSNSGIRLQLSRPS